MSAPMRILHDLFENKIRDPESWPKLAGYAVSYIKAQQEAGRAYKAQHYGPERCAQRLEEVLPRDQFLEFFNVFEEWKRTYAPQPPMTWESLTMGYPDEPDAVVKAVFDVLAPVDLELGLRVTAYSNPNGTTPTPDEVWALAQSCAEAMYTAHMRPGVKYSEGTEDAQALEILVE